MKPSTREGFQIFSAYLAPFADYEPLQRRVLHVLTALPVEVQQDFVQDPRFRVTLEDYVPGRGWTLWMPAPGPVGRDSRCVVLRASLSTCLEEFATWVIAHEFAHAYLRNGGWGQITDVEEAADALAATWGFIRPRN